MTNNPGTRRDDKQHFSHGEKIEGNTFTESYDVDKDGNITDLHTSVRAKGTKGFMVFDHHTEEWEDKTRR